MVGKTYLRYVVGPQGGAVVGNAALSVCSVVAPPSYADAAVHHTGQGRSKRRHTAVAGAVLFAASLEAVRVYSVRSGTLLHTLIPAEAKMPLEVTTIRVLPLESTTTATTAAAVARSRLEQDGWMLLVGYHNGHVAVFTCGPTNNYGLPVCRFYALGHKTDTAVLALAAGPQRAYMCSGGQDTDLTVWDLVAQEAFFRLRGHRGGVVGVEFVPQKEDRFVVTGSADGLIKVWDISIRQSLQTLVASDAQVSSLLMDSAGRRLYCGLRENLLKVFNTEALTTMDKLNAEDTEIMPVVEHGGIQRKLQKPITSLSCSHDGAFLVACTSKTLEIFRILTREEVRKKVSRKRKRRAAKNSNEEGGDDDEVVEEETGQKATEGSGRKKGSELVEENNSNNNNKNSNSGAAATASAGDEVVLLRTFFFDEKIRSACFIAPTTSTSSSSGSLRDADRLHIAVTFNNNNVRTFTTALTTSDLEGAATWTLEDIKPRHSMEERGHQSDIRQLVFVEDDTTLLSLSSEKVMMWNVSIKAQQDDGAAEDPHDFYDAKEANVHHADVTGALTCTGQVTVDGAVTMAAVSASLCCVGLQDGSVLLVDLPASAIVFTEPTVHVGGVRHVTQRPDNSGFLSVGADCRLIAWTFALLKESSNKNGTQNNDHNDANSSSAPQLLQSLEIELTETPLFVSFSPDNRFLAVGLQNTNIQLFFADTMKPYLLLFGHKLPPTAVAFSSDGTLVASVGMDKSLRFWGTDFGDCHRAIHAHDDYVTQVTFLKDTHQLLTVSLDGSVKHWDGDNWTMIQMFRQHQRGVWTVAATANGTCLATAGVDKCIRCFLRTHDIVFPAEEEERMAQEAMDEEAAKRVAMQALEQQNPEVGVAGQLTVTAAAAGEKLMEALDLVSVELQRRQNPEDVTPPHPLLANKTVWEYLWSVIESVRPSEVRHALLSLTSTHVDALLNYLEEMLRARAVLNYETAAKIVLALVTAPPGSAVGGNVARAAVAGEVSEAHGARRLNALRRMIADGLDRAVGRMDYNIAGLQFVQHTIEERDKTRFFDLSKIQGYKKKYHSRAIVGESDKKE